MEQADQIIHARWVIPIEPAGVVLEKHSVAITGERISAVIPTAFWQQRLSAATSIELGDTVLIPGLVNTHTHAAMVLFRGLADDIALTTWLERHIWPAEAKFVSREFVRDGVRIAAAEMLRGGTTCFTDMYFFPDETAAAAIDAGIRAVVGMIVIDFPSAWASDPAEYLRNGQMVHDRYRMHPLVSTAFAPHAPYTVDDDTLRRIATLAEELDVPITIHLHETESEVEAAVSEHGQRPISRLRGLGLLSPRLVAVHMTAINDNDVDLLVKNGVSVAHCPESNLKLASGFCPLAKLLDAGVNVALGTDGAASNNDLDMLSEMRCAALLGKAVAQDPCAAPAAKILAAATLGGARALGMEDDLGSIEVGKFADLVALDVSDSRALPMFNPISQIVYAAHRDQVSDVWVGGRRVVNDRQLLSIDPQTLSDVARRWGEKIRSDR